MARVHGKDGVIKIGVNVISSVVSFSISETAATAESTAMGDGVEKRLVGNKDSSGSITTRFDKSDATGQEALTAGAEVTLILQPEGDTSGDETITVDAIITEVTRNMDKDSTVERSFNFVGNGLVAYGTVV